MCRSWLFYSSYFLLLYTCTSCSSWFPVEYAQIDVAEIFTLEVPNYLKPTQELNDDAAYQAQNRGKDFCVMIRKNEWKDLALRHPNFGLEDFYEISIEQLKSDLERIEAPNPDSISLNGAPAFLGILKGNYKGDQLIFDIGIVQGKRYLYQLLIWTSVENRANYSADIQRIIQSFQEIPLPTQSEGIQLDQHSPLLPQDSSQTLSQPQNSPANP